MPVPKLLKPEISKQILDMLAAGEEVSIPGVGKLSVIGKAARTGRNPFSGETVQIPARKMLKFKQSSTVKPILNPGLAQA